MADIFDLANAIAMELERRLEGTGRNLQIIDSNSQWDAIYDKAKDKDSLQTKSDLILIPAPNISFFYQLEINDMDAILIDNVSGSIGLVKSLAIPPEKSELLEVIKKTLAIEIESNNTDIAPAERDKEIAKKRLQHINKAISTITEPKLVQACDASIQKIIEDLIKPPVNDDEENDKKAAKLADSMHDLMTRVLNKSIDTAIDIANYLRHLIIGQHLKFHVELQLGVPGKSLTQKAKRPNKEPEKRQKSVVAHLNKLMRETNYLHSLGVNILHFAPDKTHPFDTLNFDKCFCWLLLHYQKWMANNESHGQKPAEKLQSLKLKNFKSWIHQQLVLKPENNIHIVHGNNGTGKSTLAEAIELYFTNNIVRLEGYGSPQFSNFIKNYNTDEIHIDLDITTTPSDSKENKAEQKTTNQYRINQEGLWQQGRKKVPGARLNSVENFRLDQPLMSKLIDCSASARTEILLNAFFPKQADVHRNKDDKTALTKSIEDKLNSDQVALAPSTDNKLNEEQLLTRLSFVEQKSWQINIPEWEALFGVTLNELQDLALLDSSLLPIVDELKQANHTVNRAQLKSLDKIFKGLKSQQTELEDAIETALILLDKGVKGVAEWRLGAEGSQEPAAVLFNKWLEAWIFTEMDKQALATAQSLRDATENAWQIPQENPYLNEVNYSEPHIRQLRDALHKHSTAHDTLDRQVASLGQENILEAGAQYKNALNREDIAALDKVSPYLDLPQELKQPLGTLLADLMTKNSQPSGNGEGLKGSSFLLKDSWATGFRETLIKLKESLRVLTRNQMIQRVSWPFENQLNNYNNMLKDIRKLTTLNQIEGDDLFAEIQRIAEPLNELLALTTSASWQYKGIELKHSGDNGDEATSLDYGDTKLDASAILNTAELNLFTVCLFFICTPRLDNPLGLLLLDDPLQNMDELTVTTLARALGRVFRLWEGDDYFKQWQVMFLFHGHDDLERFVQEVFAARYQLPWLNKQVESNNDVESIKAFSDRSEFDVHKDSFNIKKLLSELESLDYGRPLE